MGKINMKRWNFAGGVNNRYFLSLAPRRLVKKKGGSEWQS
jgi:hypothetical protein